ncbi:RNA-binding protein [Sedimentibacter sp. zth1]|nr:RNA-binding protein [Sedimentibacter sp. zth1]
MIKLGEMQTLVVAKEVDFGVYLRENADDRKEDDVLLPIKQVPEGTKQGDKIEVFVYRDSNDRIIATTRRPKLVIGEIGYLKVVEISKIGAFLNWGLEKDLFLPYKEQISELRTNGEYMVGIYIDKSNRLCATMNLYNVLKTDSPYKVNDKVTGTVFSLRRGLGAMIAVDGKYLGMIHEKELLKPLHAGEEVEVRVNQVKEDGKLGLSLRDAPRLQIDKDGEKIYSKLIKNKGSLAFNDNSNPEEIRNTFNMSKSSFKKAIGNLMKRKLIVITRNGIELANEKNTKSNNDFKKSSGRYNKSNNNYKKSNNRYDKPKDGYKKTNDRYDKSKDGYNDFGKNKKTYRNRKSGK